MRIQLTVFLVCFLIGNLNGEYSHRSRPVEELFRSVLHPTRETEQIASLLITYSAWDKEGVQISLERIGRKHDGGYVIPSLSVEKADVIMGYGISDDISFEEQASEKYQKIAYGFDGTCSSISPNSSLCQFIPQCIVSNRYLSEYPERKKNHSTFESHLQLTGSEARKVFLKMDIEGNEYDALPSVLEHSNNITGIALELHFLQADQVLQALSLLSLLNENFLLVHVHGNNYSEGVFITNNSRGQIPRILELSYINKNLVSKCEISKNQSHPQEIDMPNRPEFTDLKFSIIPTK